MTQVDALNRDFIKYDQVAKTHTYRLAEHEADTSELRWMILRPYPAALMRAYPVGARLGNVRNNDATLLDEISRVLTWPAEEHQIDEAMKLVPDEVVQLITASGTPAECRAKVAEYIDAGCTCPVLYPLGDDVQAMIDAFSG